MPIVYRKVFTDETEEELSRMSRNEVTLDLNDREKAFCEYYIKNFNITLAAKKAGYNCKSACVVGWKLRQKPDVNRYIAWLKLRVSKDCHVDAMDLVDQYARIAFADITDFVEVKDGKVTVIDSEMMDGQIVQEIKKGRDGVTIKLADKLAAMDKLERYFDCMPRDWKQQLEERKVTILEQRLELDKQRYIPIEPDTEDDGFIDALKETATSVWEDEVEKG